MDQTKQNQVQISGPKFSFKQQNKQAITFAQTNAQNQEKSDQQEIYRPDNNAFIKKKSSKEEQLIKRQSEKLKNNSEAIREIFIRHDAKNISFQDSFVECHSQQQRKNDRNMYQENESEEDNKNMKSPQFKRFLSEQLHSSQKKIVAKTLLEDDMVESRKSLKKNLDQDEQQPQILRKQIIASKGSSKKQNLMKKYNIQNSGQSSNEKPIKVPAKNKRKVILSDSEDSDQDLRIKNLRHKYLATAK